jgi:geranylgeranyl diphosphate synthase type I
VPSTPDPSPADRTLSEVRTAVTERVLASIDALGAQFATVGTEVADPFRVAASLLAGGKRLRAAFASAGWAGFGGAPLADAIVRAGAGLEMFQMAALVHDDLMDGSSSRRGMPAAHVQFAALHADLRMRSDAERFGAAGAILLGDLLLAAASADLHDSMVRLDAEARRRGRAIVAEMMAEVTVGQYLDMYAQCAPWDPDPVVDLDRARRVIRAKSARYSVEHPLTLGAAMAGADDEAIGRCRAVGLPVGEAFQLRDDVLGVFGDPEVTGKPAGDDVREGKRTVLVTLAMTQAAPADVRLLREVLGRPDLGPDLLEEVRAVLVRSGALEQVEQLISDRTRAGLEALERAGLAEEAAGWLSHLAEQAVTRTA